MSNSVVNVKAVVVAFNQDKALVGAFSVITNLRMELFEALVCSVRCYQRVHGDLECAPGPATAVLYLDTAQR